MEPEDLERELYRIPLALRGMQLFQEGRVSEALAVAFEVVKNLRAEGENDGLIALALLDVAHCLDGTGDPETKLPVILDAVKYARRYGNDDLLVRAEIWHIDHIMTTGSFREAGQLLNALLRKRVTLKNDFNQDFLIGRLGQVYLGLANFEYAAQCFNELLHRAKTICGAWQNAEHALCGLAAALSDPIWKAFETSLFRAHLPIKRVSHGESEQSTLLRVETILSEVRGKQLPAALYLRFELMNGRLAALRGDFDESEEIARVAWKFGNQVLPQYNITRRLSHLQSILQLVRQRPAKALEHLHPRWGPALGDLETDLEVTAHEIAAAACTKQHNFAQALRHFEHIQYLISARGARNLAPVEPPFFKMGDAVHGERRHELSNAKKYSAVVSAALDAIDADLSGKYTAADLSELIGVSERRLRSALREELGCGLLQAVTRQRLLHARTLLLANRQKNQSIREIAQQVGLTRMGSFIKTYKEMFGELPSDTLRRTTESLR